MVDLGNVNLPKQARSRRTLERIVTAALEILEESGGEELTVPNVAARAGSSVGSFYARFGGKDDFLNYLSESIRTEALVRWNELLSTPRSSQLSLAQLTEHAVAALIDIGTSRVEPLRVLDRVRGGTTAFADFRQCAVEDLERLFTQHKSMIRRKDPELAVRLGLRAVLGVVDSSVSHEAPVAEQGRRLADECRDLLLGYWQGESEPVLGPNKNVDFFEVWG